MTGEQSHKAEKVDRELLGPCNSRCDQTSSICSSDHSLCCAMLVDGNSFQFPPVVNNTAESTLHPIAGSRMRQMQAVSV